MILVTYPKSETDGIVERVQTLWRQMAHVMLQLFGNIQPLLERVIAHLVVQGLG